MELYARLTKGIKAPALEAGHSSRFDPHRDVCFSLLASCPTVGFGEMCGSQYLDNVTVVYSTTHPCQIVSFLHVDRSVASTTITTLTAGVFDGLGKLERL